MLTLEQVELYWPRCPQTGFYVQHVCPHWYRIMWVCAIDVQRKVWCVFTRDVAGQNHELEWAHVFHTGVAVSEAYAQVAFPTVARDLKLRYTQHI